MGFALKLKIIRLSFANLEGFRHLIKAGVARWLKIWPGNQKVANLNPIKRPCRSVGREEKFVTFKERQFSQRLFLQYFREAISSYTSAAHIYWNGTRTEISFVKCYLSITYFKLAIKSDSNGIINCDSLAQPPKIHKYIWMLMLKFKTFCSLISVIDRLQRAWLTGDLTNNNAESVILPD